MTLICLKDDQKTLSQRFRKTDYFAFLAEGQVKVKKNPHKLSKSPEFFDYFRTLNVKTIYLKALGYKTFLRLESLGVDVYLVEDTVYYSEIEMAKLRLIDGANAKDFCTLGHKS
jgi:predicted Fe-Mo cluster-binding NifX family protein